MTLSLPRTKIIWLRRAGPDLQPLDTSGSRLRVTERRAWRLQQSDLIIRKMEPTDFGLYGCFAENEVVALFPYSPHRTFTTTRWGRT